MKDGKKAGVVLGIGAAATGLFFALKAKAAPPIPPSDIILSNLNITPSEVYVGEALNISLMTQNIGGLTGSYEVVCQITYGGGVVKTMRKTVSLQPGESKSVSFTWTPSDPVGVQTSYQVSADGLTGTIIVHPTPEALFEVSNLVIDPAEVYVGEPVSISVTVTNVGNAAGSYEVECNIV